jgi:hypothetical protein
MVPSDEVADPSVCLPTGHSSKNTNNSAQHSLNCDGSYGAQVPAHVIAKHRANVDLWVAALSSRLGSFKQLPFQISHRIGVVAAFSLL